LLKNILVYCGYSPTSPFFLLLSEHKHCDNLATNLNSKNTRSKMVASLRGSVGMGTKEDESSTDCIWLLDFTIFRPILAWHTFWNLWTVYLFNFPKFFRATVNCRYWICGYGGPPVLCYPPTHTHTRACTHIHTYIHTYKCKNIYMYICTYTHICSTCVCTSFRISLILLLLKTMYCWI